MSDDAAVELFWLPLGAGGWFVRLGRDEIGAGEMWKFELRGLVSLAGGGVDAAAVAPPRGGRAPGWAAGLEAARRGVAADVA